MENEKLRRPKLEEGSKLPVRGVNILRDTFHRVKDDQTSSCLVEMNPHQVVIHAPTGNPEGSLSQIFNLQFDTLFQILKQNNQQEGSTVSWDYIGVRLQTPKLKVDLYNNDADLVRRWRDALSLRLNQRGFLSLFRPDKKIGKGNFATVYLASKLEGGKKFAVKAFSKESAYSEEKGKESLVNEINLMRLFDHKNIIHMHQVYESDNSVYVCLDLLQGGQLYDKIKDKHKFTPQQTQTVVKGLLMGAQEMSDLGIMHRDLKPENILMRNPDDYDCVIADFGLAEQSDKESYLFVRCGTPGYVAPEVINIKDKTAKIDPICDIFSIGVIFHILLVGNSPFPGRTYNEVLIQNRACKFDFQKQEYKLSDPKAIQLMRRMLEIEPSKRICARDALMDQYFQLQNLDQQGIVVSDSLSLNREGKHPIHKTSILGSLGNSDSPVMTTQNPLRKLAQEPLRDDSCLKFVMREDTPTGKLVSQQGKQNQRPSILKKLEWLTVQNPKESRFGQQARDQQPVEGTKDDLSS